MMIKQTIPSKINTKELTSWPFFLCMVICFLQLTTGAAQEPVWAKLVAGPNHQHGIDADVDSQGNLFVIGHSSDPTLSIDGTTYPANGDGDAFIAKFSPSYQLLWFKTLGGDDDSRNDEAQDIHIDEDDNVIILVKSCGDNFTYNGDTLFYAGSPGSYSGEGVILKIDNHGNYLWHDDGTIGSTFKSITTDSTDNIYLTGDFVSSITLGGTLQLTNTTNGTTRDMFVAKYASSGGVLWANHVGGTVHNSFAYGHSIALEEDSGKVVVLGRYRNEIYFDSTTLFSGGDATFLVAYDTIGVEKWSMSLFNNGSSLCRGLAISPSGLIGVAGYNAFTTPNLIKSFLGFYDLNGNVQSENSYQGVGYSIFYSIAFNHFNECFISGAFQDSVTLGTVPDTVTLTGGASGFLLKLNSNLLPSWVSLIPTTFVNKVSCKNNRILFSARLDVPFTYYYGIQTLTTDLGDALFAEIEDPSCPISIGVDKQTACKSYTWIDGNTYTSRNNTATYTIPRGAASGCDSVVRLNLTIKHVSGIGTTSIGDTITANNAIANHQWLDCDDGYSIILGETSQSFTATKSGHYAVELTENGCIDTSLCVSIITTGVLENDFGEQLMIYPNPFKTTYTIDLGAVHEEVTITVHDLSGRLIQTVGYSDAQIIDLNLHEPPGVYLLTIESTKSSIVVKLVKE